MQNTAYTLAGKGLRRPPSEWQTGFDVSFCCGSVSGSSHTSDLKTGNTVAALPGAWCYRVGAGTGRPGVVLFPGRVVPVT